MLSKKNERLVIKELVLSIVCLAMAYYGLFIKLPNMLR